MGGCLGEQKVPECVRYSENFNPNPHGFKTITKATAEKCEL
jgi:hypothetical protein